MKTTKSGTKINKYGTRITKKEQEELKRLVNKVRYQAKKFNKGLEQYKVDTILYKEHDEIFIYPKASTNLNRFKNKNHYKNYMKKLKQATYKYYVNDQIAIQKANYIKSLYKAMPDYEETPQILEMVHNASNEYWLKFRTENPDITITFIYKDLMKSKGMYIMQNMYRSLKKV